MRPRFIKYTVVLVVAMELCGILCAGLGAGLAQFRVKQGFADYRRVATSALRLDRNSCFFFWGQRRSCYGSGRSVAAGSRSGYSYTGTQAYGCPQRRDMMLSAGIFVLLAMVCMVVVTAAAVAMLLHKPVLALVPISFSVFATALLTTAWAYVASVFHSGQYCTTLYYYFVEFNDDMAMGPTLAMQPMRRFTDLDTGFAMVVLAWLTSLASTAFLLSLLVC